MKTQDSTLWRLREARVPDRRRRSSGRRADLRTQVGVGRQQAVAAVAVDARGWDQRGRGVDELHGRKTQLAASIGLRLGKAIDDLVVRELLEPLQSKGRAD